jgi:hypothetical protein
MVPEALIKQALNHSGEGITTTILSGLKLLCSQNAYKKLSKMKGKVKYSLCVDKLRKE